MANPLAETCVHTILHPDKLAAAAALRGPSTFVVGQSMVTAAKLFGEARVAGRDVAVLFGNATDCSRLVYWGRLTAIDVGESDTHYTVFPVHSLGRGRRTQELVLGSKGERIAAGFIRPYAIVRTPGFLTATQGRPNPARQMGATSAIGNSPAAVATRLRLRIPSELPSRPAPAASAAACTRP